MPPIASEEASAIQTHDRTTCSRRRFLELAAGSAVVASGPLPVLGRAADLPHLNESDPTAQALGYREDTTKVSATRYPNHRPAQNCGRCNFYKGTGAAQWGPCLIFPGKAVHVRGWCSAYAPRP
jgi:hypothetical protein